MNSRLPFIRRERRCSYCSETGHNRRNCRSITIDDYCRFRDTAEMFSGAPLIDYRPAVNFTPIMSSREFQNMFTQMFIQGALLQDGLEEGIEEGFEEIEEVVEEVKQGINLIYYIDSESTDIKECGICLTDDIKICRMTKLNCGHEFCDKCTDKLITTQKSCCALCRREITSVEVNSGESYGVLKDNVKLLKKV